MPEPVPEPAPAGHGGSGRPPGRASTTRPRRRAFRPVALLLTLLTLLPLGPLTACVTAKGPGPAKAASLRKLDPARRGWVDRMAGWALKRMVRIRPGAYSIGSGCLISTDGWIITAAHVVGDLPSVEVFLPSGVRMPARVVLANPTNDYALLKVDAIGLVHFEPAGRPIRGSPVIAVGAWKQKGIAQYSTGKVVYPRVRIPGDTGSYYYDAVFHTAPIVPGDSGGALIDERGRLVGIHGGFTGSSSSVAPAWDQIERQVFGQDGGARDLTDLQLRYPDGTSTVKLTGRRPADFTESSGWTIDSIVETLTSLYGSHNHEAVVDVLDGTRGRYMKLREVDRRRDDDLVRAMLEDVFEELQEAFPNGAGPQPASAPEPETAPAAVGAAG